MRNRPAGRRTGRHPGKRHQTIWSIANRSEIKPESHCAVLLYPHFLRLVYTYYQKGMANQATFSRLREGRPAPRAAQYIAVMRARPSA
ncbi:hypothetical protein CHELA1G11_12072 [Hyphomicrobiales bacterium]|nr:hypothetical protein CHELA1G11_12072 [Hyphomicrobiales bacterium]CAH1663497.1 hypothetical protein CHELA1G2_12241 [Hyphomicrobiales bacterium]